MRRRGVAPSPATPTGGGDAGAPPSSADADAARRANGGEGAPAPGGMGSAAARDNDNAFRRLDESPRQVVAGMLLVLSIVAVARRDDGGGAYPGASFRSAALAVLLLCLAYTFLNARDGTMRRPHPGVWRMLHGANLWYAGMAAIFLAVRADDGTVLMGWLFPGIARSDGRGPMGGVGANVAPADGPAGGSLGTDHLDCRVTLSNLRRQVFGLWFLAHCVGWWAKMLMLRNLWTCIVYSTVFELVELTLQVLVPEFQECWWDSVVLDWLVANLCIGMTLGMITHRCLLRWPTLHWSSQDQRHDRQDWKSQFANCLAPASWTDFDWNPEDNPLSLLLNSAIWVVMLVGEVNSFFLINVLQLPRSHPFNFLRQAFFCLTALPACEEWYEYTRARTAGRGGGRAGRGPRIGQSAWLLAVTCGLETLAIIKHGRSSGLFAGAGAFHVGYWGPWSASGLTFGTYLAIHYLCYRPAGEGGGGAREEAARRCCPRWLGMLKWGSFLPLLLLCRNYAF